MLGYDRHYSTYASYPDTLKERRKTKKHKKEKKNKLKPKINKVPYIIVFFNHCTHATTTVRMALGLGWGVDTLSVKFPHLFG